MHGVPLVLVVDDDEPFRVSLVDSLVVAGYDVVVAEDGADALSQLVAGLRPDVIIADIQMPVMDGYELLRRLQSHEELREIPVIVVTGTSYSREIIGEVSFLRKPFRADVLLRVVQEWSGSARSRSR